MPKRSALPQSRHHLMLFDEDWEYLSSRYGASGVTSHVGVGEVIRALVHKAVRQLRAAETEVRDQRGSTAV